MFVSLRSIGLASIAGLSIVVLAGCGGGEPEPAPVADHDHEHEEMPETFSAAVAELKEHAPEVKEAFDAGKPEDAHDALHHLGEMSEVMTDLIDSSTLTPEQKAEAKEASETLFDQYMRLDTEVLHDASTELKYEDVAGKIDESLAKLEVLAPAEDAHAADTHAEDGAENASEEPPTDETADENPTEEALP
ncbi:MAG: hypothetical protein WD851_06385 [Pirellulales bacterium]